MIVNLDESILENYLPKNLLNSLESDSEIDDHFEIEGFLNESIHEKNKKIKEHRNFSSTNGIISLNSTESCIDSQKGGATRRYSIQTNFLKNSINNNTSNCSSFLSESSIRRNSMVIENYSNNSYNHKFNSQRDLIFSPFKSYLSINDGNFINFEHQNNSIHSKFKQDSPAISTISPIKKHSNLENFHLKTIPLDLMHQNNSEICIKDLLNNYGFNLHRYCMTRKGSLLLQHELLKIQNEDLEKMVELLVPNMATLMNDKYGNYFTQCLIAKLNQSQRIKILISIFNDFSCISCHPMGTHSLQCLVDHSNSLEEQNLFLNAINDNIIALSLNNHSTHVVQRILSLVHEHQRRSLTENLIKNLPMFVVNCNGICILKIIIKTNKDFELRSHFLSLINDDIVEIIKNRYGNYVIQEIIENWGIDQRILDKISFNFINLSILKYSSNVIERCLEICDKSTLMKWLLQISCFVNIKSLLSVKFGVFVLKKFICVIDNNLKCAFKEILSNMFPLFNGNEKIRLYDVISKM